MATKYQQIVSNFNVMMIVWREWKSQRDREKTSRMVDMARIQFIHTKGVQI